MLHACPPALCPQSLTPRQIRLLAQQGEGGSGRSARWSDHEVVCNSAGSTTIREIDPPYNQYSYSQDQRRREQERADRCGAEQHLHGRQATAAT